MKKMKDRKSLGRYGENEAINYLENNDYIIRERNFLTPMGEIDIIAEKNNEIVFVEVKARSSFAYGEAYLSVGAKKKQKYRLMALFYIQNKFYQEPAYRFDIISILLDKRKERVVSLDHYKNAYV